MNDYRNPAVAEGMQILGYVNMLNHGIPEVQRELEINGNGKAVFTIDRITVFEAKLMESGKWRSAVDTGNLPVNLPVNTENLPVRLAQVLELLKANPHISYQQIADQIGKSRETVRVYLKQLREDFKLIDRTGSDKNGKWVIVRPNKTES